MRSNEGPAMNDQIMYHNPIIPGFAPDPSVVRVGDGFYLVTSSFHIFPGLPIYYSTNLQDWKIISQSSSAPTNPWDVSSLDSGHAINRPSQLDLSQATARSFPLDTGHSMVASAGLFAPTIRHHRGIFFIVCTNCFHHEDAWRYENFIISCEDVESGTWSDPLFFPFQGIDPDLFFDEDGRAYVSGSWQMSRLKQPSCTIKQFEIDVASGKPLSEPSEIWGGYARYDTEGPHIYKKGAWYYLLVAEGGTFEHHLLSIARSRNVAGPYESFAGNPILTADGKDEYIQNVGHGDLFQDEYGSWWAAVLGVRNQPGQPLGRETFLTPVDWPAGGWPRISQPAMKFCRHSIFGTGPNHTASYDNRNEFCYVRNAILAHYRLSKESRGLISLRPTPNVLSSSTGTFTFIGKRQRSMKCVATTILELAGQSEGSEDLIAGLVLYKDHLRYASIAYNSGASQVQLDISDSESHGCQSQARKVSSSIKRLGLKIAAFPDKYVFFYHDGLAPGGSWAELGGVDTQYLHAREFTGPVLGIFATGGNKEAVFNDFVIQ